MGERTTRARFVAEVSSNHGRDRERCLAFVDAAADAGCAAVKFQQFRIRRLFAPEALAAHPELLAREEWELPVEFHAELAAHARARGIDYACTPFDAGAVDALAPHVDFFKMSSYQLPWLDGLRAVAATGRPVVLATGMADLGEVRDACAALEGAGATDVTLLHCVSQYPCPPAEANLAAIDTLRAATGLPCGWSDHTVDARTVERAVRRYHASLVEFHLDLEGAGAEYTGGHCWLPDAIAAVIAGLDDPPSDPAWLAGGDERDGDGRKVPRPCEEHERGWRSDPSDGLRPSLAVRATLG
jgi:N-acetylneuraminate synthase